MDASAAAPPSDRSGPRARFTLNAHTLLVAAQGQLAMCLGPDAADLAVWPPSQVPTGIAAGLVPRARSAAVVAAPLPARFGIGSSLSNALRQIGGAIGAAVAIGLVGRTGASLEAFRMRLGLPAVSEFAVSRLALPRARRGARLHADAAGARP